MREQNKPGSIGLPTLGNSDQTDLTWPTQSTRHAQNTVAARRATVSMRRSERNGYSCAGPKSNLYSGARTRSNTNTSTQHCKTCSRETNPGKPLFPFFLFLDPHQAGGAWIEKGEQGQLVTLALQDHIWIGQQGPRPHLGWSR